jgi:hypothetical protein
MRLETQTKRLTLKGTAVARESSASPAGNGGHCQIHRPYRICSQPILGRNLNVLTWPEATSNGSTLTPESVRKC